MNKKYIINLILTILILVDYNLGQTYNGCGPAKFNIDRKLKLFGQKSLIKCCNSYFNNYFKNKIYNFSFSVMIYAMVIVMERNFAMINLNHVCRMLAMI